MDFLTKVSEFILNELKQNKPGDAVVILPSQRSASVLKSLLISKLPKGRPLPYVLTTEFFFMQASRLYTISEWQGINLLQQIAVKHLPDLNSDLLTLEYYLPKILNDFNEIHRSLANPVHIFENLRNIKEIENWSLSQEPLTQTQKEYLDLMSALGNIYKEFYDTLLQNKQNFGSLHYRYVAENPNLVEYAFGNAFFYVAGLNALNACEEKIYHKLYQEKKLEFFFDADEGLMNEAGQEYGLFLRNHKTRLKKNKLLWEENHFGSYGKNIEIHEFTGLNEEAHFGAFYINRADQNPEESERYAIIVANEKLWPLLLPKIADKFSRINVSAEIPAHILPGFSVIHSFFELYMHAQEEAYLFNSHTELSDVCRTFFTDPDVCAVLSTYNKKIEEEINFDICDLEFYKNFLPDFMTGTGLSTELKVNACIKFLRLLASSAEESIRSSLFLQVAEFCEEALFEWKNHPPLREDYAWLWLFKKISELPVSLKSERSSKIQVMGFLESRCLDFENILVLGVQEGIIPSGIRSDSFLPLDLKRFFKIPVYSERDAIFAYHFFRLLHHPKNISLSFHTGYFGENHSVSRFVKQILMEWPESGRKHPLKIYHHKDDAIHITKTPREWYLSDQEKKKFQEWLSESGISFSTLWDWRTCSLKHYFRKIAGITPIEETEKMANPAEFGDILHKVLYTIYTPLISDLSSINSLSEISIKGLIENVFKEIFGSGFKKSGALNIQSELAEKIIIKRWEIDKQDFNEGKLTKILMLEKKLEYYHNLESQQIKFTGVIDRVDFYNGNVRIIDYKTNVTAYDKFSLPEWDQDNWLDSSKRKMTQLIYYSWLFKNNGPTPHPFQSCILPLNFHHATPKYVIIQNESNINNEILNVFENDIVEFLKNYLSEPFVTRTENKNACKFCDYRAFCHYD
jgi:CRISPR/Cas system-associated exonuclease Cas4 (RecB family)